MKDLDKRACELSDLARQRPTRPPISPVERRARRWFLGIAVAWGGVVYALILAQGWGSVSPWELILAGPFMALCVLCAYAFHLFYTELGKSVLRMLRGKKTGE